MEYLSGGDCDCDCCDCDGGKTKSTPSLGFRLRLEFDKNALILEPFVRFKKFKGLNRSELNFLLIGPNVCAKSEI